VAAFGYQDDFLAPGAERAAELLFAVAVAFGGIDQVEAGVDRGIEKLRERAPVGAAATALRAAEADSADAKPGASEDSMFDWKLLPAIAVKRSRATAMLPVSLSSRR